MTVRRSPTRRQDPRLTRRAVRAIPAVSDPLFLLSAPPDPARVMSSPSTTTPEAFLSAASDVPERQRVGHDGGRRAADDLTLVDLTAAFAAWDAHPGGAREANRCEDAFQAHAAAIGTTATRLRVQWAAARIGATEPQSDRHPVRSGQQATPETGTKSAPPGSSMAAPNIGPGQGRGADG